MYNIYGFSYSLLDEKIELMLKDMEFKYELVWFCEINLRVVKFLFKKYVFMSWIGNNDDKDWCLRYNINFWLIRNGFVNVIYLLEIFFDFVWKYILDFVCLLKEVNNERMFVLMCCLDYFLNLNKKEMLGLGFSEEDFLLLKFFCVFEILDDIFLDY